uniref:Uncharacterized protein n=1 Tax=Myripristis murdjan TaxID=586833 RepID=A0A668A970_9TELE
KPEAATVLWVLLLEFVSVSLNLGFKFYVLQSLFGSRLSSLILAPPTPDDITEGSAQSPAPSSSSSASPLHAARGLAGRQEVVPGFFLDFLQRHRKLRGRSRKSMLGGRGCFGMKMDRIGSLSGLGC